MKGVVPKEDLAGKRYGKLLVIERTGKKKGSWLCKCDCGNTVSLPASDFTKGGQIACGCMAGKGNKKHGMWNTSFYRKWGSMKRRCNDTKNIQYFRYGGRGIRCEWKTFEEFKRDMYESYLDHKASNKNTSIERVNNDGNYCKENCRWATMREQGQNRRSSVYIEYKGETKTLPEWARFAGISEDTLYGRMHNLGWSIEEALTRKPNLANASLRKI